MPELRLGIQKWKNPLRTSKRVRYSESSILPLIFLTESDQEGCSPPSEPHFPSRLTEFTTGILEFLSKEPSPPNSSPPSLQHCYTGLNLPYHPYCQAVQCCQAHQSHQKTNHQGEDYEQFALQFLQGIQKFPLHYSVMQQHQQNDRKVHHLMIISLHYKHSMRKNDLFHFNFLSNQNDRK